MLMVPRTCLSDPERWCTELPRYFNHKLKDKHKQKLAETEVHRADLRLFVVYANKGNFIALKERVTKNEIPCVRNVPPSIDGCECLIKGTSSIAPQHSKY